MKKEAGIVYDLLTRNCTDWAIEVARIAGQTVPTVRGFWYFRANNPGQFGEALVKLGGVRRQKLP